MMQFVKFVNFHPFSYFCVVTAVTLHFLIQTTTPRDGGHRSEKGFVLRGQERFRFLVQISDCFGFVEGAIRNKDNLI